MPALPGGNTAAARQRRALDRLGELGMTRGGSAGGVGFDPGELFLAPTDLRAAVRCRLGVTR